MGKNCYLIGCTLNYFINFAAIDGGYLSGILSNRPYALTTTAVSVDLGTHRSLRGNSCALATVTSIIDGSRSIGAAIGPLLTGYISTQSWSALLTMLMVASFVAGLFLTRLVVAEINTKCEDSRWIAIPDN
ncbi:putative glycerol-3-phosphate transporter 1 [Rutidosis leptorrhynchoides]|uniref:putative glycerol-3-phosphate transporter 1 n=1 Tax=Rutidosis leptorrhynchoides TaxID=125765 RepID=UPI003A98F66A